MEVVRNLPADIDPTAPDPPRSDRGPEDQPRPRSSAAGNPPPPRRARARKGKAGRFRRWVLRPLLWGLAGLAVLVFVVQLLLNTRWARSAARDVIVEQVSRVLQREVELVDVSFELLPLSVEVWGLTIGGPDGLDPAFVHVPWAAVDADLNALQHGKLHLQQVRVERPVIHMHWFPDGTSNLLKFKKRARRPSSFEILIDRIEIDQVDFALDQEKVRLSLSGDSVRARLRGLGDRHVGGQVAAHEVVVRLPYAKPLTVSVAAEGHLSRGHVEITESRISGPDVEIRSSGTCDWVTGDRLNRKCLFQATGRGSGRALRALDYFDDLEGSFDFSGTFAWRPATTGWRGRIDAREVDLWGRRFEELAGAVAADRYGARVTVDRARYAGGELAGSIVYEHREEGRPFIVDLDVDGLLLDRLLADQGIPSSGYAARIGGDVFYRFPFGEPGLGDGHAEVTVASDPALTGVALVGAFPLRIDRGVVRGDAISLRSENQSVLAGGWYSLERFTGAYDYEIASADLTELVPLLPLRPSDEIPLWLPTAGQGELAGTLYLEPGETTTDLRLRLEEVRTPSLAARRVTGNLRLDRSRIDPLRLELGDGDQALLFYGKVPFEPTDDDPTELVFDAFDWPLASAGPWLAFELPVDGPISGRLDLRVGSDASSGRMTASVAPAALRLVTDPAAPPLLLDVDRLSGRLAWERDGIRFEELDFEAESGEMTGHGSYSWASEEVDLELRSSALELGAAPLSAYLPRADIRGVVAVEAHLDGPLERPRIELDVGARQLALGERILTARPSRLAIFSDRGRLTAEGRLLEMVTLQGGGEMDGRGTDLRFGLAGSDVSGLLELLFEEPPEGVDGEFRGTLTVRRAAAGPVQVGLELDPLSVELQGRTLDSLEPVRLALERDLLSIESLRLGEAATGSEIALTGGLGYAEGGPLDLRLEGTVDAGWLALLGFDFEVGGTLELATAIGGTLERPALDGRSRVRDGRLAFGGDFPYHVTDLSGQVLLYPEKVVIDHLEGRLAGGDVAISGEIGVERPERPLWYRVGMTAENLHMLYPEGWSLRGSSELTMRSTETGHLVDGRAQLTDFEYNQDIRFDLAELMRGFLRRQRLEVEPADSLLSAVELNVEFEAPGALRVRNNLADLTGSADFVLRGNLAQPVVHGVLDIDAGGELVYNSTDYEVERGRLDFTDPYRLDPEVDLVLRTQVRDFDVTLALSGTLERLETRFSSEPPLPDLEVFRLLATGDTTPQTTDLEPRLADRREDDSTSAATFLYGQAASVLGERFNTLFGFDKFRVDPLTGSGDNWSKARVTVGKRLSKDFFVTYSVDPSSTEEQRLRVEWQVSPGLVLVLSQNGDNTYSADARWEASF